MGVAEFNHPVFSDVSLSFDGIRKVNATNARYTILDFQYYAQSADLLLVRMVASRIQEVTPSLRETPESFYHWVERNSSDVLRTRTFVITPIHAPREMESDLHRVLTVLAKKDADVNLLEDHLLDVAATLATHVANETWQTTGAALYSTITGTDFEQKTFRILRERGLLLPVLYNPRGRKPEQHWQFKPGLHQLPN